MMKKRWTAMILTLTLALGLLAGCGQQSGGGSSGQSSPAPSATPGSGSGTPSAQPEEEQVLTVWCWDPAYNINALNVAAEIYKRDHPNFTLKVEEMGAQDIAQKLATSTSAGNMAEVLPDVLLFDDSIVKQILMGYPDAFADLTDSGFPFDQFPQSKVSYSVVNDRHYGIPFDSGAAMAAYRTDILAEAGYTLDDFTDITWSRFIELGKDVLAKTGKPLLNGLSAYNQLDIMLTSCGGGYFGYDGKLDVVGNEKLRKCCEIYIEMVKAGVYQEEVGWDTYIGNMNNGSVAGAMNGCWLMASIQAAEDQSGKWGITNLPKVDGIDGATNFSSQGGSTWTVTSVCKDQALAVDFFKSTFAGSTELYDSILPSGVLATWQPAAASPAYTEPADFYGGQPVFAILTQFSASVPRCPVHAYQGTARNAVIQALVNVIYTGADLDAELAAAAETIAFEMGS